MCYGLKRIIPRQGYLANCSKILTHFQRYFVIISIQAYQSFWSYFKRGHHCHPCLLIYYTPQTHSFMIWRTFVSLSTSLIVCLWNANMMYLIWINAWAVLLNEPVFLFLEVSCPLHKIMFFYNNGYIMSMKITSRWYMILIVNHFLGLVVSITGSWNSIPWS